MPNYFLSEKADQLRKYKVKMNFFIIIKKKTCFSISVKYKCIVCTFRGEYEMPF